MNQLRSPTKLAAWLVETQSRHDEMKDSFRTVPDVSGIRAVVHLLDEVKEELERVEALFAEKVEGLASDRQVRGAAGGGVKVGLPLSASPARAAPAPMMSRRGA
jgi:hypothetical protein